MQFNVSLLMIPILHCLSIHAQQENNKYPQGYFRWPLDLRPEIVANFGELRTDHWHLGLDIRTAQKENQPVYAAAEGYIAKISIEPFGFGRAIYINHPNGLTTLYAHLNDFNPALEQYVTDQQYDQQTWAIELLFTPQQFPVSRGSFIAYSGNTGNSQGPHVHFEIRDTKTDKCLNPLLFGLPLPDSVPPTLVKLAIHDRNFSGYKQKQQIFDLKKTDSVYIIPKMPVVKTGWKKINFAIQAYDRMSGSANRDGIYCAKLFFDEKLVIGFELDSLSYAMAEYMKAHINFRHKYNGGPYLQQFTQLPGDKGTVYKQYSGDGAIYLSDTNIHTVSIAIKDAYNNSSSLNFSIQYDASPDQPMPSPLFSPGNVNVLKKPGFEVYLPDNCLYDTIPVLYYTSNKQSPGSVSAIHSLNDPSIPVHGSFTVRIKPTEELPAKWHDKVILQREYGNKKTIRKAGVQKGWLVADFGDFGNFQAFLDLEPPTINEPGKPARLPRGSQSLTETGGSDTINLSTAANIIFRPSDNFTVKSFRAQLDGQWLRFTNDKGRYYIYTFDERCPDGVHELKVWAEDIVGNTTIKTWWFKKYPYTPPPKKKTIKKTGGKKIKNKK